jgi:hypothetical protein
LPQLFVSFSSDTLFGASAQACTKYAPATVSAYSVTVTTELAFAPGASAGTL